MSTSQNLVELAKQGNPKAIEALMNRHLQPKGITARAIIKDSCLKILLEAADAPDEQTMIDFVQKGLTALNSPKITSAKVFGQQIGEGIPAWIHSIELSSDLDVISVQKVHTEIVEESVRCPKCGSAQVVANKKGFGVGKAAVGVLLLGPLGLTGGLIGSNQILLSCVKCGNQWEPKKVTENKQKRLDQQVSAIDLTVKDKQVIKNQQEPIKNPQSIIKRVTKATIKTMSQQEINSTSLVAFLIFSLLSVVCFNIPYIGLILGLILLALAIYYPYVYLSRDSNFISKLTGNCPYCNKEISTEIKSKEFNCLHCKEHINVKDRKYYTDAAYLED